MKLFRHLGLIIAVFWCAAMVVVPMAAAAGAGQGTNQGPAPGQGMSAGQGNNQMQQGPGQSGSDNPVNQQGNGLNPATPGQGSRPGEFGNATMFRNGTIPATGTGNMTAPPGKPDWDPANMTALNNTARHGHGSANLTDIPPPMDWNPANSTGMNNTGWHGDGNMTMPAPPVQGSVPAQDGQQTQDQVNSTGDLLAQFLEWLRTRASG